MSYGCFDSRGKLDSGGRERSDVEETFMCMLEQPKCVLSKVRGMVRQEPEWLRRMAVHDGET